MPPHEKRLASLDAVRGIAALSVAIPHFFLFRGYQSEALEFISIMAVEVFFVLSGVVLAPQLLHCAKTGAFHDVMVFYARRWMRTLPPFIFVLVAIAIVTGNLLTNDFWLWPAPGSEDTEFGVLMEPEVRHGEAEVYTRVQA